MNSQESPIRLIKKVYNTTLKALKENPTFLIPFIIFSIFELLASVTIYFIPRMPLRLIFGPIIRAFWGERFLHYPLNFLLFPKFTSFSRMLLSVILGSLLTGVAVAIILNIYKKERLNLLESFKAALKKYISLFFIVFIYMATFYLSLKVISIFLIKYFMAGHTRLLFLEPQVWLGTVLICLNIIFSLFIRSAFIYAIPVLMIDNEKLKKSIIKSFALFKRRFIPTVILVGLPMLIYAPIAILNYNSIFLMQRLFPESILLVSFLSIIVISLVIDPLVIMTTTLLYLMQRKD